jgi:hypothetical protein
MLSYFSKWCQLLTVVECLKRLAHERGQMHRDHDITNSLDKSWSVWKTFHAEKFRIATLQQKLQNIKLKLMMRPSFTEWQHEHKRRKRVLSNYQMHHLINIVVKIQLRNVIHTWKDRVQFTSRRSDEPNLESTSSC